jgi:hypothetical protein
MARMEAERATFSHAQNIGLNEPIMSPHSSLAAPSCPECAGQTQGFQCSTCQRSHGGTTTFGTSNLGTTGLTENVIDKSRIAQNIDNVPKSGNYNIGVYDKLSKEPGLI